MASDETAKFIAIFNAIPSEIRLKVIDQLIECNYRPQRMFLRLPRADEVHPTPVDASRITYLERALAKNKIYYSRMYQRRIELTPVVLMPYNQDMVSGYGSSTLCGIP